MRISQRVHRGLAALLVTAAAVTGAAQPASAAVDSTVRLTPSFNGSVYAIAYRGDTVYVGGSFTSTVIGGRTVRRERLAAFDARTGAIRDWAPRADDTVRALAVSGGSVYAGGDFDAIDGRSRDSLARLDAATGAVGDFAHSVDGGVHALAAGHGRLYAAGSISRVDGLDRSRLAAFTLDDGTLDEDWTPTADNTVNALAAHGSRIYLGGSFHRADGVRSTARLAAVDADSGELVTGFRPSAPAAVYAIAADDSGVYAAMGGAGGKAAAWTTGGGNRWTRVFDGDVQAVAVLDGTAYVGGHFDRACSAGDNATSGECRSDSVSRVKLAAIARNGSLTDWDPHANGVVGVRTIVVDRARGTVAAGGDFTTIGGQSQKRFAAFG